MKVIDVPFKTKLFNVNIRNRNLIATFVVTGFFGTKFEGSFPASIPSWFGILLYMDLKSKVTRNVSYAIFSASLILLIKSAVPFI